MERWGKVVLGLGLVGFVVTPIVASSHHRSLEDTVVLSSLGIWMLVSVLGALLLLRGREKGAVQVMSRAGRICLRCRYPLPGTEPMGVCPECGDAFTMDDNVLAWRSRYPWLRL
jgi:hypothetical protein